MFDDNLVSSNLLRDKRRIRLYLVGEIKRYLPYEVFLPVVFPKHRPERVLDATDEIIETTVFILWLVIVDVPDSFLHRRRYHVLLQVLRVVPVPGIAEQMAGYQLEVFADLRRRLSGLLAFLQLFRELL